MGGWLLFLKALLYCKAAECLTLALRASYYIQYPDLLKYLWDRFSAQKQRLRLTSISIVSVFGWDFAVCDTATELLHPARSDAIFSPGNNREIMLLL